MILGELALSELTSTQMASTATIH